MRQYTVLAGKRVQSNFLEKGDLLLMDAERWAVRAWSAEKKRFGSHVMLSLAYLPAIIILFLISSQEAGIEFYVVMFSMIMISIPLMWAFLWLGGLWMGLRSVDKGPGVPGLYTNGIQTHIDIEGGSFIPYGEIEWIKVERLLVIDMVVILIKGRRLRYAAFPRALLGDEGMESLLIMAGKGSEPPVLPRLVLYAPADSPLATLQKDDDAGSTGSSVAVSSTFPQRRY